MIKVFKIGGNVIDDEAALAAFAADFAAVGGRKILIHGGGKIATAMAAKLGLSVTMVDGRRVTDAEMIKLVTQVYAGGVNKEVVCRLQSHGADAVGICGADGAAMVSVRRAVGEVDYGFVGDLDESGVNADFLLSLLDGGKTPVIAPITMSRNYELLNTNADTVAQSVAVALSQREETELIFCFEREGVMRDMNDQESVISKIDAALYKELRGQKVVFEGMIPKIDNAFNAISKGVAKVCICSSTNILKPGYGGTIIE